MRLFEAVDKNNINEVKLLLENGADVHEMHDDALRRSSQLGHLEIVKLLLEYGADVHVFSDYAIKHASYFGHLEVVKLLVEHGAKIKSSSNEFDAIDLAKANNKTEVVNYLNKLFLRETLIDL
jgi:ankyrin repeat protein